MLSFQNNIFNEVKLELSQIKESIILLEKKHMQPNEKSKGEGINSLEKENPFSEKSDLYVLRDNITEGIIDFSMRIKERYFLLYNLFPLKEFDKIEFPYSSPTVGELLQMFINNIKLNNKTFFNKKILTSTKIVTSSHDNKYEENKEYEEDEKEGYVTIFFSTKTSQLTFEIIEPKAVKREIYNKKLYVIIVQKIGENITQPGCCYNVNTPLFCCGDKCIKPKYLCHCCYCPPCITCCKKEVESYNNGILNCFYCYCPAISGCCVHKLKKSDHNDLMYFD